MVVVLLQAPTVQYGPQSEEDIPVQRAIIFLMLTLASRLIQAAPPLPSTPMPVVASFSILGDWVRVLGGERVKVLTLIGPNEDSHGWQPSPATARQFSGARLVVVNGLGLDDRVQKLALASGFRGEIVIASRGIKALPSGEKHGHAGHDHQAVDPHAWQDIAQAAVYVDTIVAALIRVDPVGAAFYRQRAQAYHVELDKVAAWSQQQFKVLKPAQRRAIVSHDAFAYFARRFGLELIPVQGKSGESQASAQLVASLIRQIRSTRLKAVFVENINNGRLTGQIARETGVVLGGELYSDALSQKDGPAADYLSFYRHNVRVMVSGMRRN